MRTQMSANYADHMDKLKLTLGAKTVKKILLLSFIAGSIAACSSGKTNYEVSKFTDSTTNNCVVVTNNYDANDPINGIYCKARLTQ